MASLEEGVAHGSGEFARDENLEWISIEEIALHQQPPFAKTYGRPTRMKLTSLMTFSLVQVSLWLVCADYVRKTQSPFNMKIADYANLFLPTE